MNNRSTERCEQNHASHIFNPKKGFVLAWFCDYKYRPLRLLAGLWFFAATPRSFDWLM